MRTVDRFAFSRLRIAAMVALAGCLSLGLTHSVAAAGPTVECGQLVVYAAPDPVAPADGSLTLGLLTPWVVAADAVVGANAAAALPSLAGTGPTCLTFDTDSGGVITALDFAATGTITGSVVADSGVGGYILADRLLVPTFITDAYPELAAIFVASEAAGTPVTATLSADTSAGTLTAVDVTAFFCGKATLDGSANAQIGQAVIPAVVLDNADRRAIQDADGHRRCALVETTGTVGQQLLLSTEVTITGGPSPTPPDTATDVRPAGLQAGSIDGVTLGFAFVIAVGLALGTLRVRPRR